MKRFFKGIIWFLFFICFGSTLFGQNGDLKYYVDYNNDFKGYAFAGLLKGAEDSTTDLDLDFLNLKEEDLHKAIFDGVDIFFSSMDLAPLKRVTKNNVWLLNKAVDEWDYYPGDMFFGICADSRTAKEGIFGLVMIGEEGKKSWRYYYCQNSDAVFKKFEDAKSSPDSLLDRVTELVTEKIATVVLEHIPHEIKEEFSLNSIEDLFNLVESSDE